MSPLRRIIHPAALAACLVMLAGASGCAKMPHRDDANRSSAALDVSAAAILSYRPLSEDGARYVQRFRLAPRAQAGDRVLVRDRRGKQMAAYDHAQWAGGAP